MKKVCDILFRAKAINRNKGYHKTKYKNGDWVYGLVTRLYDGRFENLPAEMTDINGVSGIEVDYKTIGQFTGLVDNNGNDIFEGDVVDYISSDVIGNRCGSLVDGSATKVLDSNKHLVKIIAWYDNELGYTCQMLRTMIKLLKK